MDRATARRKVEQDAQRNDMKQHANKLIQGFQKLGDSHAKRAIWELFQNAFAASILNLHRRGTFASATKNHFLTADNTKNKSHSRERLF